MDNRQMRIEKRGHQTAIRLVVYIMNAAVYFSSVSPAIIGPNVSLEASF